MLPSEEGGGTEELRFPPPSPPEGCSIAAAAGSSPWHLGTAVWQRSSWALVTMHYPGPSLSCPTQHFWVTLQSSNAPFKAPLLISRAFCKHQLLQAVNGVAAVDSRKQLRENSPKAIRAHFPNSNGKRRAENRGGETQSDALGHFQVLVACGLDCPLGESPVCKAPVLCQHFRHSRSPRTLCPANVFRLCVQGKGFLLASPGTSLCILLW